MSGKLFMKNSQRMLVKIIREICAEMNIELECYSFDWILRMTKNGKNRHIFGYHFENNSATTQLICTDKCATSELLLSAQIPAIEHIFFSSPENFQYLGVEGNWQRLCDLLRQHGRLVVKPNEGTGGNDVFQVSNNAELEAAVNAVFTHSRSMAVCPYYEIAREYRIIVLNDKVMLIYSKDIPALVGDGSSTLRQLILGQATLAGSSELLDSLDEEKLQRVPASGEKIPLGWKHNLGQGASPDVIEDPELKATLSELALKAALVLNAKFASVDIIRTEGDYRVLEVNSGIMMENFAAKNESNYAVAKSIYRQALESLFGLE